MRSSPLILALLAALAQPAGARAQSVSGACPAVSVSCPETATPGLPVTYTANVSGGDPKVNPTFRWVVSAGVITSGLGTSSVTVDTTGVPFFENEPLTATVEVGGYPADCRARVSCAVGVARIVDHFPTDEYGDISFRDERARLDNFAVDLQSGTGFDGYIICYGGRRGRRGEARARCARARNYLVARRNIPARRIVTIDGGYREQLTVTLWPLPRGARFTPSPTVDPSEVEFTGGPKGRRARRKT